jgi:valyl-tRNA synthetase
VERKVSAAYDSYDVQEATQALHKFFWAELCDWYIEVSKKRLNDPAQKQTPQWVLLRCIEAFVTMMHPIMPHITEEVYSFLPLENKAKFVMSAKWPELNESYNQPDVEAKVERIFAITRALRALRFDLGIAAMKEIPAAFCDGDIGQGQEIVASQAWVSEIKQAKPEGGHFLSTSVEGVDLYLPVEGFADIEKLTAGLKKDLEKIEAERVRITGQLTNADFIQRAKPEVVEKLRGRESEIDQEVEKIKSRLALFSEI